MEELAREFHEELKATLPILAAIGWLPKWFSPMLARLEGVGAAKQLVSDRNTQTGLWDVVSRNRPELAVEWIMLKPKYRSLFEDVERAEAARRLQNVRVTPPGSG